MENGSSFVLVGFRFWMDYRARSCEVRSSLTLFSISCCDKHCDKKYLVEEKIYLILQSMSPTMTCNHDASQGGNLEAGTKADTREECRLLPCLSWLAKSAFSYKTGPPAQVWHCPYRTGPSYINHYSKNFFQGFIYGPI